MNFRKIAARNLTGNIGRTFILVFLVFLLSFTMFGGSVIVTSLRKGVQNLEGRIGADVICVPNSARSKVDLDGILLQGTTGYFYMDRSYYEKILEVDGVEQASPQIFLASLRASCCSIPVQVIGFDPETDFSVQPWIAKSYSKSLNDYDVVVGSRVNADIGENIMIYNQKCRVVSRLEATGTGMDTAVYGTISTVRLLLDAARELGHDLKISGDVNDVISAVYIKVREGVDPQKVADDINVHIRKVEAVKTKSMLTGISDSLSGISGITGGLVVMIWIVIVLILAAAFAMMTRERKKEFAVLRVIGASRKMLASLLIRETGMVVLAGSVLGIAVSLLAVIPFSGLIESVLGLPFLTPSLSELILLSCLTLLMSLLTGGAASAVTVLKLCRVDSGAALREER